jgi:uncharacterized membrane protein
MTTLVARITPPTTPLFTVLLLAHVLSALVGFGSMALTGLFAWRAAGGPATPFAPQVRRYFRPGVNWAGRLVYLVPVFGVALILTSPHSYGFGDRFVQTGVGLWVLAAGLAESLVWPAERRIQDIVSGEWAELAGEDLSRLCRQVAGAALLLVVVFLVAVVLMFNQG